MKFETLQPHEVQSILFELKSKTAAKAFFGEHFDRVINPLIVAGVVKFPLDYVRGLSTERMTNEVALFGGQRQFALFYGVSTSFVKTELTRRFPSSVCTRVPLTKERLVSELERLGSVRMTCRVLGLKESEVRKVAKEEGIVLAPYLNFSFGNYEVHRGRRAELYWKGVRGDKITRDLAGDENSQADYDFEDSEYGRVNVKGSKQYRYKAKSRGKQHYWSFSLSSLEKCDTVVFALYDRMFENPVGWAAIRVCDLIPYLPSGKTSLSLCEDDLQLIGDGQFKVVSWRVSGGMNPCPNP